MNKTFEQTITKTYSIADIYGTDDPRIPGGYEAVEFRLAKKGEDFLSNSGCGDVFKAANDWPGRSPRIILRKLPPEPTVESVYGNPNPTIPDGWEKWIFGFRRWVSVS